MIGLCGISNVGDGDWRCCCCCCCTLFKYCICCSCINFFLCVITSISGSKLRCKAFKLSICSRSSSTCLRNFVNAITCLSASVAASSAIIASLERYCSNFFFNTFRSASSLATRILARCNKSFFASTLSTKRLTMTFVSLSNDPFLPSASSAKTFNSAACFSMMVIFSWCDFSNVSNFSLYSVSFLAINFLLSLTSFSNFVNFNCNFLCANAFASAASRSASNVFSTLPNALFKSLFFFHLLANLCIKLFFFILRPAILFPNKFPIFAFNAFSLTTFNSSFNFDSLRFDFFLSNAANFFSSCNTFSDWAFISCCIRLCSARSFFNNSSFSSTDFNFSSRSFFNNMAALSWSSFNFFAAASCSTFNFLAASNSDLSYACCIASSFSLSVSNSILFFKLFELRLLSNSKRFIFSFCFFRFSSIFFFSFSSCACCSCNFLLISFCCFFNFCCNSSCSFLNLSSCFFFSSSA